MDEMTWDNLRKCWAYLSHEDSDLYSSVIESDDPKDQLIKALLEKIAYASRSAHRNSRY